MEDIEEPCSENERLKSNLNVSEVLDIIREDNPELDKFKKVSMSSSGFISDTISDVFSEDITDVIGCIEELDEDVVGGKYCFKLVKDDFAIVYTSFPFWFKVTFLFYNDEEKIKEQFSDKIFSKAICEPGVYDLRRSNGHYGLVEIKVAEDGGPELDGGMFEEIYGDIDMFFGNEKIYTENSLPYKRGILLYGPPGNGKSSIIKKIFIDNPNKVCIIIDHDLIEGPLNSFLSHITKGRDKIIIIEDIDSVQEYSRSTFLNFLDGVEGLDRTFIIATTNYLSKLDPAICNRPSRFDKTYHFGIPKTETRKRIIKRYFKNIDEKTLDSAAEASNDFSGAYIKELFIQCSIQGIDIIKGIENIKKRTSDYHSYKEPSYYG